MGNKSAGSHKMNDAMFCVYCATNAINNKKYIGLTTKGLAKRINQHIYCANTGSKKVFHRAIRKYGIKAFKWKILFIGKTIEELRQAERLYITKYDSLGCGYNSTSGGDGIRDYTFTDKQKERLRKNKLKREIICINNNQIYSSIKEAAQTLGLDPSSVHAVCSGKLDHTNQFMFKYTNVELDECAQRRREDRRQKRKISRQNAAKAAQSARRKPVKCVTDNLDFESVRAAAKKYQCASGEVSKCCQGRIKAVKDKVFIYIEQQTYNKDNNQ